MSVDESALTPRGRLANMPYRWKAMWIVLLGTFMVVLDTTIVSIGLKAVGDDFHADANLEWVVTSYIVALGVSQLVSGWLGDRYGRSRLYVVALAVFTVGSLGCAVAPTFGVLIVARVVQGAGGGVVMPIAMAIIFDLFDPGERGRAIGYFSIAVMAAPAIGPVLGGTLVSSIGWRWLFLVNVPIGLLAVPITARLLRPSGVLVQRRFDAFGFAIVSVGLVALLVGLQQGGAWGWSTGPVVGLLAGGSLLIAVFSVRALGLESPLADVRLFANPIYALSLLVMSLSVTAQYVRIVYIPLELQGLRGIDASTVGWLMMPSAVGMAMTLPLGGRLTDRLGSRLPVTFGMAVVAVAFWELGHLSATTSLWEISIWIFLGGLGSGIGMTAPNVTSVNAVRAEQVGQATALGQVARQVTLALGLGVLASIFAGMAPARGDASPAARASALDAFNTMFLLGFWILIAVMVAAQFLPGKAKSREMHERLLAERGERQLAVALEA